ADMVHLGRYLRIDDNPILEEAAARQERMLPVFALDPSERRGRAQEAFLMSALAQMQQELRARGSDLLVVHEPPPAEVADRYTSPMQMIPDEDLPFDAAKMPKTYTPFRQEIERHGLRYTRPRDPLQTLPPIPEGVTCPTLPMPTTPTAEEHWHQYRERRLPDTYKQTRNGLLHADDSSRLSPWLAWGCISPRRVADDLRVYEERYGANEGTYWLWFELLWRDFFSLRAEHRGVLLDNVNVDLSDVGHPFVNAGLRELTETGFMSNRMRQIVASYCIYEANIPWQVGAAYFAEHLIDHDPASNIGNWKYIAGTGADPRGGRRFNIEKQREMYDADGAYLQRWGGR
ncbi:MAG: hypothetical protein EHM43_11480, partial [Ignavibacteriae bacterium]